MAPRSPARTRPSRTSDRPPVTLILAAGHGKRMKSSQVKLLHTVGGIPVVSHVVEAARSLPSRRVVAVLGVQAQAVRAAMESTFTADGAQPRRSGPPLEFCTQQKQLGTAHAVLAAEKQLGRERGTLLILNGDVPLVSAATLRALVEHHRSSGAALTVLTTTIDEPAGYGRIVRGLGAELVAIREQADIAGDPGLESITEINAGLYCAELDGLFEALRATSRRNAQNEYYLPDLVGVLRDTGRRVEAMEHDAAEEVLGINTREDLARAARSLYRRRAKELMAEGVTLLDPDTAWIDPGVTVGADTVIHPMVRIEAGSRIGPECVIHSGTRIERSTIDRGAIVLDHCVISESVIGPGARIGPFAHLRPGSVLGRGVHVGNFVETKKAAIGDGSKANHLAYLGDTEIGRDVNVGAGTITCNYDGWDKHRTVLEDGVFIGSDTQLVAPVKVGRGSFVGAGSTITKDVPPGALALSRVQQKTIPGWAEKKRREMAAGRKAPAKSGRGKKRR